MIVSIFSFDDKNILIKGRTMKMKRNYEEMITGHEKGWMLLPKIAR